MFPSPNAVAADLFYLPTIEFFVSIKEFDTLLICPEDLYQKQSYRNRTPILLANKVEKLIVPVYGGNRKNKIKEIQIDYDQKWLNIHLRGIQSAYGKGPYFEYFYSELESVYLKKKKYLFDLNLELLTLCLKFLRCNAKLVEVAEKTPNYGYMDLRGVIKAKESFQKRNIYQPYSYIQLFGLNFVPNLSVIDLLFCEGPQAKRIMECSHKKKLNNI